LKIWLLAVLSAVTIFAHDQASAPVQPIPFSHKQHTAAASLKCNDCHKPVDIGEIESIPKAKTCMACHQTVKADSSAIRALRAYAESNRPIPWVRVYEIPGFVNFSHKVHLDSGASCETCHGPVAERDQLWRETDISMNGCVACHQSRKASANCSICHDLQH
jgi:c(7)-type cytochrome triheme protein